ncbi:MAG: GNAT family N-acetyltransferase [Candidatus Dormibacteria bacterium]
MLDRRQLLAAYDLQVRPTEHRGLPPGVRAEPDGPIVRVVGRKEGFISAPRELGLSGDQVDALIRRQRDFFAARAEAVEWKLRSHDLPADLPERLTAAGFLPQEQETVLIGLAKRMAAAGSPPPAGIEVREAEGEPDLRRIAAMESAVWGEDRSWLADDLLSRKRADPDGLRILVAAWGDEVVSAAWLEFNPGTEFAGLWGGSTATGWRRRGIYRALVATRARLAAAAGYAYLQVDASPQSRPILERLGMVKVTSTTPYVWSPREGATTPGPGATA